MANPVLVVMAAGMGSRYGGLKQIDPVGPNGQIIMHYSIYDAWKAGFRRVVFIIKEELLDAFRERIGNAAEKLMQVDYVFQSPDKLPEGCTMPEGRTKPLGTGHAIYCVRGVVNEPFAVINADDFYGAQAFQCLYDYLKDAQDDDKYRYCMVGYRVENTLTENGTVSRGICEADENGYLADIVERTAISRDANGVISDPEAGEIAEGTLVSMNMWGFTPSFLDELETGLRTFMTDELPKNPAKGEYYLPFAVDHLIQNGQATAKVLQTSAQWYGVTYKEDKPVVVDALRRMTEAGLYPAE
ncbi:MAG: sugar phosphate nucleotidyltransferase [Eubacteriales bacterium]|nr:sugar phosphate nucleotidyltransferase [Eubacteriales bacterium]